MPKGSIIGAISYNIGILYYFKENKFTLKPDYLKTNHYIMFIFFIQIKPIKNLIQLRRCFKKIDTIELKNFFNQSKTLNIMIK